MKNIHLIIIPLAILLLVFTFLFADEKALKGKDVVKHGKLKKFSGEMIEKDKEWYLISNGDTLKLHFGPSKFLTDKKVKLKESKLLTPSLNYFKNLLQIDHAFQIHFDGPFIEKNCFETKKAVKVPAETFLSQLV